MSDIAQMMRAANPVPDSAAALTDDELESLLLLTQSRSGIVDVKQQETQVGQEKQKPRGWLVAVAAFAAVVVLVGAAWLLARPADTPPAAPPTTQAVVPTTVQEVVPPTTQAVVPTTVAAGQDTSTTTAAPVLDEESVAFVEAMVAELNAGDYESAAARILSANEFRMSGFLNDPRTYVAGMYQYWTEMDSTIEVTDCTTSSTSGLTRCILSRTSEFEPFSPEPETGVFQVRVEDGEIAFGSQDPEQTAAWWPIYLDFREWMTANHPEDVGKLDNFTDAPAAAALTKQYAEEWRASLEG